MISSAHHHNMPPQKASLLKFRALASTAFFALSMLFTQNSFAQVNLAQGPMLTLKTAPGLVMLTMGRDLPLYKAAYNDVNDLDGDGVPDLFFKPSFKYEGYFAYDRCYNYVAGVFSPDKVGTVIIPDATDTSKNYYKCPGQWSGNFLNWIAMARIDVLRKVLYGGKRSTDTAGAGGTVTILERTYVPQDSTIWGKEYASVVNDGYDIREYTPLSLPTGATRHMFANTTLNATTRYAKTVDAPMMIVYQNRPGRIWNLVAQERLILGTNPGVSPAPSTAQGTVITQYIVRVETCKLISGKYEDGCTGYPTAAPTTYKPTGLLHKYGEAKTLAFGLISGTYDNNYAGGVLRKNVDNFGSEVDATNGRYVTTVKGIVYHLDSFRPWGFGGGDWACGSFVGLPNNGACPAWGNPLGEMMFEGLQYFAGGNATPAYTTGVGTGTNSAELSTKLDLQQPAWLNPYTASASRSNVAAYPSCARPVQMTIGDPKTSFDSDHLPGSAFSIGTGMGVNSTPTLGSLNVSTEASNIWADEFGAGASRKFFIGEVLGNKDGNPSAKTATSFSNIRGHGPDATTNEGGFYGASVARYGKYTGLSNPAIPSTTLRVNQISIALDSHVPQIKIPLGGKTISIVLLSKSVNLYSISNAKGAYQQTGAITAFFIDQMANTNASNANAAINGGLPYYKFRISFSDADQGNDNESDAKVTYEIKVTSPTTLTVGVDYFEGSNGIEMHQGYVISGTTNDGVYLDVGGAGGFRGPTYGNSMLPPAVGYYLDTMPGMSPGSAMAAPATGPNYTNIATRLPNTTLAAPRTFTVGVGGAGEFVPHDMLWYATKYGSAVIDNTGTFKGFKLKPNGDPESYYLVNNPSTLAAQMGQAFQKAASLSVATSSAVAGTGAKVVGGSLIYQASYDSENWGGELSAFTVLPDGNISSTPTWLATTKQLVPTTRNVVLGRGGSTKSPSINATSYSTLTSGEQTTFKDDATFKYLLGDRTKEQNQAGGTMRNRTSAIGDIVNSDPLYIGKTDFGYIDTAYDTFKTTSDPKLVGIGSNDGFYRLLSGTTGDEKLAFIPNTISGDMVKLADPGYTHQFYVDGPAAFGHVKFSTGNWNAVVAASLGAGNKALFAINASAANLATTSDGVLWEFAGSSTGNGQYLGNVLNKPLVGQLSGATGLPAVLVGNGINSFNGQASLLVLNAETGAVIRICTPNDAANTTNNGMTSLAFVSYSNNGKIDLVYGADYKGNIWRIDPNDTSCNASAVKVFTARNSSNQIQAITGELAVTKAPDSKPGYMILFGTGKYAAATDPGITEVQSLYGVWDEGTSTSTVGATRANLIAYPIGSADLVTVSRTTAIKADVNGGKAWYESPTPASVRGWMVDLTCTSCPVGERFVDKPIVTGSSSNPSAYFLTYVPGTDPCQVGGGAWITGFDPNTGTYAKAYASLAPNSIYVNGAAPRGLFIVKKEATTTALGAEYLYISRNDPPGNTSPPGFNDVSGGTTRGSDGNGITNSGVEIPCPTCSVTNVLGRRQVWRQLQ